MMITRPVPYLFLLTGCGYQPSIAVSKVSPELAGVFSELQTEYNALAGYPAIRSNPGGYSLVASTPMLQESTATPGAMGVCDYIRFRIAIADQLVNDDRLKMALAHELAHAMGHYGHTDTGLMSPKGDKMCLGREAECLFDALSHLQ